MGGLLIICRISAAKSALLLGVVVCAFMSSGCTYLQYRGEDALEMMDIGITVSYKPGLAVWFAAPFSLVAAIGGHVDGYVIGIGGGRPFFTPHYLNAIGFVAFGFEEIGWGWEFDKDKPETLYRTYQGALGIPVSLFLARPAYVPTCTHEVHLGFIGVIANLRYMEVLDFILGFADLDIAGDDGDQLGHWPWRTEEGMNEQSGWWPW